MPARVPLGRIVAAGTRAGWHTPDNLSLIRYKIRTQVSVRVDLRRVPYLPSLNRTGLVAPNDFDLVAAFTAGKAVATAAINVNASA